MEAFSNHLAGLKGGGRGGQNLQFETPGPTFVSPRQHIFRGSAQNSTQLSYDISYIPRLILKVSKNGKRTAK